MNVLEIYKQQKAASAQVVRDIEKALAQKKLPVVILEGCGPGPRLLHLVIGTGQTFSRDTETCIIEAINGMMRKVLLVAVEEAKSITSKTKAAARSEVREMLSDLGIETVPESKEKKRKAARRTKR